MARRRPYCIPGSRRQWLVVSAALVVGGYTVLELVVLGPAGRGGASFIAKLRGFLDSHLLVSVEADPASPAEVTSLPAAWVPADTVVVTTSAPFVSNDVPAHSPTTPVANTGGRDASHKAADKASTTTSTTQILMPAATAFRGATSAPSLATTRTTSTTMDFDAGAVVALSSNLVDEAFVGALHEIQWRSDGLGQVCNEQYGAAMLNFARAHVIQICVPHRAAPWSQDGLSATDLVSPPSQSHSALGSAVYCHQRKPYDVSRYFCVFENAQLVRYDGQYRKKPQVAQHGAQFETKNCTMHLKLPDASLAWGWWEKKTMNNVAVRPALNCTQVVEHSVLLYALWTAPNGQNFYEYFHDFLMMFETLAILRWKPSDVEPLLTNVGTGKNGHLTEYTAPFFEIVERMFIARGIHTADKAYPVGTCFSRIGLPPSPGLSSLTAFQGRLHGKIKCRAPEIASVARFVMKIFPEATREPRELITFMNRPRRTGKMKKDQNRYINDEGVALEVNKRLVKAGRTDLKTHVHNPAGVKLSIGLGLMARTAFLVGVHGAGLTHVLWLRNPAVLLELFCHDRLHVNGHYMTISHMLGIKYVWLEQQGGCEGHTIGAVAGAIMANLPAPIPQKDGQP